jgi:hypothetical protein
VWSPPKKTFSSFAPFVLSSAEVPCRKEEEGTVPTYLSNNEIVPLLQSHNFSMLKNLQRSTAVQIQVKLTPIVYTKTGVNMDDKAELREIITDLKTILKDTLKVLKPEGD